MLTLQTLQIAVGLLSFSNSKYFHKINVLHLAVSCQVHVYLGTVHIRCES